MTDKSFLIGGANGKHVELNGRMANRHGLVAGATGTGAWEYPYF